MEAVTGPTLMLVTQVTTNIEKCKAITELHQVHAQIIKTNLVTDTFLLGKLISSYCLSGGLNHAISVFYRLRNPNPFIFFTLIKSLSETSNPLDSVSLYAHMLTCLDDLKGVHFSLPSVLKACGRSKALHEGKQFHAQISKTRFLFDPFVANSLIRMYLEAGELRSARNLFDEMPERDIYSWNSMLTGYLRLGDTDSARDMFDEMPERDSVSYNAMIDGYGKCGNSEMAEEIFGLMSVRNDVKTWTSMISMYVLIGRPRKALDLFRTMLSEGVQPDGPALVCALSAISDLGFSEEGKWIHSHYMATNKIRISSGFIGSALIDMYAKCGEIENAYRTFRIVSHHRNIADWNSMISGLALHGLGNEAIEIFADMERLGIEPDEITFLGLLSACSHGGLVEYGRYFFRIMYEKYRVLPKVQHYGAVIDLLGRAGYLKDAIGFLQKMPIEPDVLAWKAILSNSVKHGDVAVGEKAAIKAIELAPKDSSCYVLLSNIYAKMGRFDDVAMVRREMKRRRVRKVPGCSSIWVGGKVHSFLAGQEMDGKCNNEVRSKIEELVSRLRSEGYEPDLSQVLVDVEEEGKESLLSVHSEKLAIAFGLINVRNGDTIRVVKNLRVCGDCHSFIKLVSRVYDRRIVVRDQNRFHHFENGVCSCNEFW